MTNKTLIFLLMFALCSCQNQKYEVPQNYLQDFAKVDGISFDQHSKEKPQSAEEASESMKMLEEVKSKQISLDIAKLRELTLEINLDLKISYVTPQIAASQVLEEQAKFDAVFSFEAQHRSTRINDFKEYETDSEVALTIPLETGGYLKTSIPYLKNDYWDHLGGLNMAISQPLLRNAGVSVNDASIAVAKVQEKRQRAGTKLNVIRLLAVVEKAYWDYYAAEQILGIYYKLHELAKDQHELAKLMVKQGVTTKLDELNAESNTTRTLESIFNAETNRRIFERRLKALLNMNTADMSSSIKILANEKPAPYSLKLDPQELSELAVSNRLDMLQLEMDLSIQALTIDYLDNQTLPLFSVNFDYQLNSHSNKFDHGLTHFNAHDQRQWIAGLKFEMPWHNTAAKERLKQSQLEKLIIANEKDKLKLQIHEEVHNVVDQLNNAWQKLLLAKRESQLNNRVYLTEVNGFKNGTSSSNDIRQSQDRLASSQIRYTLALRDYEKAKINLAFASGTILGKSRIEW